MLDGYSPPIQQYCYLYCSIVDDPRLSFYGLHKPILQKDDPRQKINRKNRRNSYFTNPADRNFIVYLCYMKLIISHIIIYNDKLTAIRCIEDAIISHRKQMVTNEVSPDNVAPH